LTIEVYLGGISDLAKFQVGASVLDVVGSREYLTHGRGMGGGEAKY
jgi:hypothetical protein